MKEKLYIKILWKKIWKILTLESASQKHKRFWNLHSDNNEQTFIIFSQL